MNWDSIPIEAVGDGIRRQMVTGERLMMCRLQLAPHTVTPVHSREWFPSLPAMTTQ